MAKFDINTLVRDTIRQLQPYSSARQEFTGTARIFLDANENALGSPAGGELHRYPDPLQKTLKVKIAALKNVASEQIFLANGSDESIDLLLRAFCEPAEDSIVITPPTYGMYAVSAAINNVPVRCVPLRDDFQLDVPAIVAKIDKRTKLIFLCSPNNPTGNCLHAADIEHLLRAFSGLLVLDEAYIDFAEDKSFVPFLDEHPNLVILQTLSKAWGLAGARIGMAIAAPEIIAVLNKIKPPYNVSENSQQLALTALENTAQKQQMVSKILQQRDWLKAELAYIDAVEKIYPSEANFLLVKTSSPKEIYSALVKNGIIVRDRSSAEKCAGCLRITVGTAAENRQLIAALRRFAGMAPESEPVQSNELPARTARIHRKTSETDIEIELDLDGNGSYDIDTGLGFFDHMLAQLARHSQCDLRIRVSGDLHIDEHHTIEDTALALGQAFQQALGDKRGIERYGFLLPMDDALAQVALDFSGRSWLVWNAEFTREKIGEVPTEMFEHFFKSFCDTAKCNLNIKIEGDNEHHKIEAAFKAVGKSIKMAIKRDPHKMDIPSTKGTL